MIIRVLTNLVLCALALLPQSLVLRDAEAQALRRPDKSAYAYVRYWSFLPKSDEYVGAYILEPADARETLSTMAGKSLGSYMAMKPGSYTLGMRVIDAAGNAKSQDPQDNFVTDFAPVADSYYTFLITPGDKPGAIAVRLINDTYDLKTTDHNTVFVVLGDPELETVIYASPPLGTFTPELYTPAKIAETKESSIQVKMRVKMKGAPADTAFDMIPVANFDMARQMYVILTKNIFGETDVNTMWAGKTLTANGSPEMEVTEEPPQE